jgi:NAD(P)H dehydrogenase (quinone)
MKIGIRGAAGLLAPDGHHGAIYHATGPESFDGPARAALMADVLKQPYNFVQASLVPMT